ncbi:bifunctional tRNA (5-methylaminomethyl-2-thiouridine)(34)-methyltransferase MnmD/FAD-dependent 5-carboxymethylaminomethyl-2-thiouridine(34) oxidoreductase MnmC [Paraglaciecola aestuariivivens]
MNLENANIRFNENGTPYATDFADLYFSDAQGLDESLYVFIQNNHLLERWQTWSKPYFVIAETGFGTGLNILLTIKLFEQFCANNKNVNFTLHFISIEKFPISQSDLQKALAYYPDLAPYAQSLLAQYPPALAGCHRLNFLSNKVVLDLWLGDVQQVLGQIDCPAKGLIDAWFLDGFAPSKNPDMWTQTLFEQMALLAKDQCHFATFTAAGFVKRGLVEAGFTVEKRPGHGRKREMLAGKITKTQVAATGQPYYFRLPARVSQLSPKVAIIGAGIAGANCAYALSKRGIKSTVYCQDQQLAQGASGNAQGGFYPQLNAEAGHASQIHSLGFSYASRLYKQLLSSGQNFSHAWCGTLLLAFNQKLKQRYAKLSQKGTWPTDFIHAVDAHQATQIAKIPLPYSGLFVPLGGWINLPELVASLIQQADAKLATNKQLSQLTPKDQSWQLAWQDGSETYADLVILATGSDSVEIQQLSSLPFRLVRGQVEAIESQGELTNLTTVLCHKGYLTPAWQGRHALGSTYIKNDRECDYRLAEQHTNLSMHQQALSLCDWVQSIRPTQAGRAAIRCSTPDHLPMVGAVPNVEEQTQQYQDLYKALPASHYPSPINHPNLFMLSGLGSRGLTTAPLCAEILASQILQQPLPLSNHLLAALNPNRFLIRGLIRRQL